ncbi:MAG: ROK family protein [Clostridiales Family XIII bacterium]|jgi:glucokinase|nr:ROK family protein [Clostridiales Family XIII bacterium]
MNYDIGVDIGGTKIAIALVEDGRSIASKTSFPTYEYIDPAKAVERIADAVRLLVSAAELEMKDIRSVGIGTAGLANRRDGILETSPNLGWKDVPLTAMLEAKLGIMAIIENDANAAALGEHLAGAATDAHTSLMVTLGTGIGGGFVIGDYLHKGINFAELEVGHMVIKQGGRHCRCGRNGCFERYASATGLNITTRHIMKKYPESAMWEAVGGDVKKITTFTAFDAAAKGDEAATVVIDKFLTDLSTGITNLINIFQPDVLCIGGGLAARDDELLVPLKRKAAEEVYSRASAVNTVIKKAKLGNDAGLIGAANLVGLKTF